MNLDKWRKLHRQTISFNGKNCATPIQTVQNMIDNLDMDWSNSDLKICDPCAGFGTFLVLVREKLKQYGHSENHINTNMLYGYEVNKMQIGLLQKLGFKNIYHQSYVESEI